MLSLLERVPEVPTGFDSGLEARRVLAVPQRSGSELELQKGSKIEILVAISFPCRVLTSGMPS